MENTTATSPANLAPAPAILVNFDNKLDYKSAKYSFRSVTDEKTGVKTKRPTVELDKIPVPSVEGVVAILETGGKALDLLLEAVANVPLDQIREILNANEAVTAENFPYDQLDWNFIAALEREERRSGISKETWEEFAADYVETMPAVSGTTKEQCINAAKIFAGKFNSIKSKKDVIAKLKVRLAMYAEHSPKASEFSECIDYLFKRADKLIEAKEVSLEENLGF